MGKTGYPIYASVFFGLLSGIHIAAVSYPIALSAVQGPKADSTRFMFGLIRAVFFLVNVIIGLHEKSQKDLSQCAGIHRTLDKYISGGSLCKPYSG